MIMKKIAQEYMKTHLKVRLAGEHMNSNMKKPEEVEQSPGTKKWDPEKRYFMWQRNFCPSS